MNATRWMLIIGLSLALSGFGAAALTDFSLAQATPDSGPLPTPARSAAACPQGMLLVAPRPAAVRAGETVDLFIRTYAPTARAADVKVSATAAEGEWVGPAAGVTRKNGELTLKWRAPAKDTLPPSDPTGRSARDYLLSVYAFDLEQKNCRTDVTIRVRW